MGIGYGVTEKFECVDGYPKSRFGTIGFMKASEAPELSVILCEPEEKDKLPYSLGAKGCGELCMIPTAPACAHAYYRLDGVFRQSLPLEHTPYRNRIRLTIRAAQNPSSGLFSSYYYISISNFYFTAVSQFPSLKVRFQETFHACPSPGSV